MSTISVESRDSVTLKQQRKVAYEALAGPLERLSVKQVVEFRSQSQVPKLVEEICVGAVGLIAEVDNTMVIEGVDKKSWQAAQKVMSKPGYFINAMRRFPYAVDSGRIADVSMVDIRKIVQSGVEPGPTDHHVAHQIHQWLCAAYQYFQLRKKPPSRGPSIQSNGSNPAPAATAGGSGNAFTPPKAKPSVTTKWKAPAPGLGSSSSTGSTFSQTQSSGVGGAGNLAPSSRQRPITPTTNKRPITPSGGNNLSTNRHSNGSTGTGLRPPSAKLTRPASSSSNAPSADYSNMSSEARRLALGGLPDYEIELEQMRREIRELKSQESKQKWDLLREEKHLVKEGQKDQLAELREWRLQEANALKEMEEKRKEEERQKELRESKDFTEYKRERKRMEREEDQKRIEEDYQYSREQAEWRQQLVLQERVVEEKRAKEKAEKVVIDREIKRKMDQDNKNESQEDRLLERKLEIEKMKKELVRQKEELLRHVDYSSKRMAAPIKKDMYV